MSGEGSAHQLLSRLQRATREQHELVAALFVAYGERFQRSCEDQGLTFDEADDAVQETLIRIVSKIHTYDVRRDSDAGAEGWMHAIRRNLANDMLRGRARRQEVSIFESGSDHGAAGVTDPDIDDVVDVLLDGEDVIEKNQLLIVRGFVVAVEQLSKDDREDLRQGPSATKQRQSLLDAAKRFRESLTAQLVDAWKPRSR